jgi:hypothetical protein
MVSTETFYYFKNSDINKRELLHNKTIIKNQKKFKEVYAYMAESGRFRT